MTTPKPPITKPEEKADELNIPLCDGKHPRLGCERERARELLFWGLKQQKQQLVGKIENLHTYNTMLAWDKNFVSLDEVISLIQEDE